MTSYTQNINLLKKDPLLDGAENFNITTMLNDNWDKIDAWANGRSKIQTGSYTGTGTFGSNNSNQLTFDFVPQVVIVAGFSTYGTRLILINPQTVAENETAGNSSSTYVGTNTVFWNDNTVFWYSSKTYIQLNMSGVVYKYIAIG